MFGEVTLLCTAHVWLCVSPGISDFSVFRLCSCSKMDVTQAAAATFLLIGSWTCKGIYQPRYVTTVTQRVLKSLINHPLNIQLLFLSIGFFFLSILPIQHKKYTFPFSVSVSLYQNWCFLQPNWRCHLVQQLELERWIYRAGCLLPAPGTNKTFIGKERKEIIASI